MSIIGVQFNLVLSCGSHVRAVVRKAARSMYALKTIKGLRLAGHAISGGSRVWGCIHHQLKLNLYMVLLTT